MQRVILACVALMTLPLVSAHGGETEDAATMSASQVLLLAAIGAAMVWQLTASVWPAKSAMLSPVMAGLSTFTGVVHLLLGLEDPLLLLGGTGVMVITIALLVWNLNPQRERQVFVAMTALLVVMFVGYFAANHDPGMIMEDRLGVATKLAEVTLLLLLYRAWRLDSKPSSR
ncbi:MAG: hypothetical protein ACPHJD_02880 [Poseidonia sp.]|jgi:hypothetical protein